MRDTSDCFYGSIQRSMTQSGPRQQVEQ